MAIALLLAGGGTFLVFDRVGPTHEVEASVLLFPPIRAVEQSDTSVTQGNPYLYLGGLNPARDVLVRKMTSQTVRDALAKNHPEADYEMVPDISTAGPVINLSVSAPTPSEAVAALDALLEQVPEALEELQKGLGITSSAMITSRSLAVAQRPEVVHKAQLRASIVTAAGIMTVAVLAIGLLDGLLLARRTRRAELPGRPERQQRRQRRPDSARRSRPASAPRAPGGPAARDDALRAEPEPRVTADT